MGQNKDVKLGLHKTNRSAALVVVNWGTVQTRTAKVCPARIFEILTLFV